MSDHSSIHPHTFQATAIFEAAATVLQEGVKVFPHIMVPLVGIGHELETQVGLMCGGVGDFVGQA